MVMRARIEHVQFRHRRRPITHVHVVIVSILRSLSAKHRITKEGVKFTQLVYDARRQFYQEAVRHILNFPLRNLTKYAVAYRVASAYNI